MRQLQTGKDLDDALKKAGFIVIRKRPLKNSRIHETECGSLERMIMFVGDDSRLGTGKARQEYYYCENWMEAVKQWNDVVGGHRGLGSCKMCKPSPPNR